MINKKYLEKQKEESQKALQNLINDYHKISTIIEQIKGRIQLLDELIKSEEENSESSESTASK